LEFSNVGFKWAVNPQDQITVSGGNHLDLGYIVLYDSKAPSILNYDQIPNHQAIIYIDHEYENLFEFFQLYVSYDPSGNDSQLLETLIPGTTNVTIKESGESVYVALKSIPYQGDLSNFSPWTKIYFTEVIDPDADKSVIIYKNFFEASITWQPTGYEGYYQGFRIATENEFSEISFISPILSASTF